MAQFCTKCGTPLPEGMRFCTGCGAVVGAPAAAAAPGPAGSGFGAPLTAVPAGGVGEVPIAAQAGLASAAPVAAPSKSSPVVKIVLIVVAVLIFFGMLSAGACVYLVYRAKQRVNQFEKQARARMNSPSSPWRVPNQPGASDQPAASVVDTNVPVYPGAVAAEGQSAAIGVAGINLQQYTTSDSVDRVVTFYKDKLGPNAIAMQSGSQASIRVVGSNAMITIVIRVDNASGKTKIAVTTIGKP